MTDKELIKQKLIKLKNEQLSIFSKGENDEICGTALICIGVYNQLLSFINSLPEEPASEDLDYLVISLEETIGTSPHSREVIKEYLQKAAEWQKEKIMKDAVELTITNTSFIPLPKLDIKADDKVKIIIVKEN